jgi:hypothetical protein
VSVALIIQHEKCMPSVLLSSVPCPTQQEFSTLFHKRHYFREKITEHNVCVVILSTILSEMFLNPRKIQRDIVINVRTSSRKMEAILTDFNET